MHRRRQVANRSPRLAVAAALVLANITLAGRGLTQAPASGGPGGRVVVDSFRSQALGKRKHVLVWLPPSYEQSRRRYPVAYYLHGAFGDETNWTKLGHLDGTLDSLTVAGMPEMIVVMPDGDDSWYTTWNFLGDEPGCRRAHAAPNTEPADSYCVPWPHYDDYIARDLVAYIDRTYRTLADRQHRGIAGLSMGGYGAVMFALEYPTVFGAAASHSGVLAPLVGLPHTRGDSVPRYATAVDSARLNYGALWGTLRLALGKDTAAWYARDPARAATRLAAAHPDLRPRLRIDCGSDDPYLAQNRAFKAALDSLGWPVEYTEWPGSHSWDYWRRHSVESLNWLSHLLSMP